jgi:hypothetical protein
MTNQQYIWPNSLVFMYHYMKMSERFAQIILHFQYSWGGKGTLVPLTSQEWWGILANRMLPYVQVRFILQ